MNDSSTLLNAGIGAVVSIVTSFLPFSPVLGGAVAGYLEGGTGSDGTRVGALSGALSLLPLVFFAFIVLLFLTGAAPAEGAATFAFALLVVGALGVAYTVGLGALGGYLGAYVLEETGGPRDDGSIAREFPDEVRSRDEIPGESRPRDERWGDDGWSDERRDSRESGWGDDESDVAREKSRDDEY